MKKLIESEEEGKECGWRESMLVPPYAIVAWVCYVPNEKSGFLIITSEKTTGWR